MTTTRADYRVIIDALDRYGVVTRGTVVSFSTMPNNIIRVVVKKKRKRTSYDIKVDPKETANAALVSAMYEIRHKL